MSTSHEWSVQLTNQAQKDLRRIRRDALTKVHSKLSRLKTNPTAGEPLSGALLGARSLHFSLPGSGQYRAAYVCDEDRYVYIVFMIGPRENFYRTAQRRWDALRLE